MSAVRDFSQGPVQDAESVPIEGTPAGAEPPTQSHAQLTTPPASAPPQGSSTGQQPHHQSRVHLTVPSSHIRNASRSRHSHRRASSGAFSHSPNRSAEGHMRPRDNSMLSTISSTNGLRHRRRRRSSTVVSVHADAGPIHAESIPGAEPGIDTAREDDELPEHLSNLYADCDITIVDYCEDDCLIRECDNHSLASVLHEPRPEGMPCRWISVNGISWDVIRIIGKKYRLHQLAVEDLIHSKTRTKVDWYAEHAAIVLTLQKLVRLHQHRNYARRDCPDCGVEDDVDSSADHVMDEKETNHIEASRPRFPWSRQKQQSSLPVYREQNEKGLPEDIVTAHSDTSAKSPVKPIRTLHRYESATIPEHTEWMEKHSALVADNFVVSVEQVVIFLTGDNTVISFFEQSALDVEAPILKRLQSKYTVLRESCDASMLLQAIIDAVVDLATPVRDAYNKARKELQIAAFSHPDIRTSRALHIFGEEIDMLQNLFKPIVHLVNALRDHNSDSSIMTQSQTGPERGDQVPEMKSASPKQSKRDREGTLRTSLTDAKRVSYRRKDGPSSVSITPLAHVYFGDVLDHCITTIAAFEQMDASASNISNLIFNTVSARTNNFMMILAVVTVFFAPLTFISGYFGMNFASGAGLAHPFSFFFVVAMPSVVGFMLLVWAIYKSDAILESLAQGSWGPRFRAWGWIRRRSMP